MRTSCGILRGRDGLTLLPINGRRGDKAEEIHGALDAFFITHRLDEDVPFRREAVGRGGVADSRETNPNAISNRAPAQRITYGRNSGHS